MAEVKYLFSMGELSRKDNSIRFKNAKGNNYYPIETLKEIYCLNEISLNSKLFDFLAKANIPIHFFNYYGYYSGSFIPKRHYISGDLTIKQSLAHIEHRVTIAKSIVLGIAKNIYEILYHYYRHGKKELKDLLDWLKSGIEKYLSKNLEINQILFIEGQIWSKFYDSFKYFLPEDFLMNKRVKRPPDNPMNAMVSFGNSLLYAKTISELSKTHLNQEVSFLHSPREARYSLSLDISEVFKPIVVFKSIFELVNTKKLQVSKHFDKKLNYGLLNDNGKKVFIEAYESRLSEVFMHPKLKRKVSLKSAIKYDGHKLKKFILERREFTPFSIKDKM